MKFLFKTLLLLSFLCGIFGFSQKKKVAKVKRATVEAKIPMVVEVAKTVRAIDGHTEFHDQEALKKPLKSSRDSIQHDVYEVITGTYYWDEQKDEDSVKTDISKDREDDKIFTLQDKVQASKGLRKALFAYYLANTYQSYLREFGYRAGNITPLANLPADYRQWARSDFDAQTEKNYELAMSFAEILKSEKTELWEDLVDDTEYAQYKPTLYDLVATDYMQFLNSKGISADADAKIAKIKQELYDFHKNDTDKTALLYLQSTEISGSAEEQSKKLEELADAHLSEPFAAYLLYQSAQLMGNSYLPEHNIRAHNLCTKTISAVPASDWQNYCKKLINGLEDQSISLRFPKNNPPGEYIPAFVEQKNASDFSIEYSKESVDFPKWVGDFKDIKSSYDLEDRNGNIEDQHFKKEEFHLKKFTDYTQHQTFVAMKPLEKGIYSLAIKTGDEEDKGTLAVTDFMHLLREETNSQVTFQILNSVTGKAVADQPFVMYQNINTFDRKNQNGREGKLIKTGDGTTDGTGLFSLPKSKERDYSGTIVYFPNLKEYIVLGEDYDNVNSEKREKEQSEPRKNFIIHTDRAIYRPGQKVYYKAILMQEFFDQTKVFEKQRVTIEFFQGYDNKIATIEAVTNEFGSISGEFILPAGKVGNYYISFTVPNPDLKSEKKYLVKTAKDIEVEEYKRPRFEAKANPVKGTYRFGDMVTVSGSADAFSGAKISGAKVKYSVRRDRVYFWRYYYYDDYTRLDNDNATVANGETTTDESGNFKITFKADPAEKDFTKNRSYQYSVQFDITDTNGETQSGSQLVYVGDLPAKISLSLPETARQQDIKSVDISVKNLNDQTISANGKLTVTKLITADKIILPKYQNQFYNNFRHTKNAYQIYDKALFDAYFPNLTYDFPDMKPHKGEVVLTKDFKTENSAKIDLNTTLKPGKYLFEAESIFKNDTIRNYKIVEVLDDTTLDNGSPVFFKSFAENTALKVGEKGKLSFNTSFPEGYLNYTFLRSGKRGKTVQIPFKNGVAEINFSPTLQDMKDGLFIQYDFIHSNDFVAETRQIKVLEGINRDLEITTEVFRDKITPGAKEKWRLKIKDKDSKKIGAEVLAAMYDASLDQFAENSFKFFEQQPQPRFDQYDYRWDYYDRAGRLLTFLQDFDDPVLGFGEDRFKLNKDTEFPEIELPKFTEKEIEVRRYSNSSNKAAMIEEAVVVGYAGKPKARLPIYVIDGKVSDKNLPEDQIAESKFLESAVAVSIYGEEARGGAYVITSKKAKQEELLTKVTARKNLDETAFFFPTLTTDQNGETTVEFTSPEALTKWKFMVFAHTKDLKTGYAEFTTRTQKEIMVTPNPPRFLRQGDQITFSTKIDNLSDERLKGDATLYLFDPKTKKPLDSAFVNKNYLMKFDLASKTSQNVEWTLKVPNNITEVGYKILAGTKTFSDGEENIIPILSNRIMLTDTQSIFVKEGQTKTYEIPEILNPTSQTASNFKLTVDLTANPVWFAVMSVPYLRQYPYECSEQLFSRLYGNMLSTYIMNSSPKIRKIFDEWNAKPELANPLEQNEELKTILLEETPWIRELKSDEDKMKEIARLFELNKMTRDLKKAQRDLVDRQNPDGSFSWFPGGGKDKTISAHILAGFGKLKLLLKDSTEDFFTTEIKKVIKNSIKDIDEDYYEKLIEERKRTDKIDNEDYADYFYTRSFWLKDQPIPEELYKVLNPLSKIYDQNFEGYSLFSQAKIATVMNRFGYKDLAKKMIASLKKRAINTKERGMFWEENYSGWYWYQSPVSTQAMLIGAFAEITPEDEKSVEEMKIWLLKNKQTDGWGNTRATTEAVFALMHYGKSWLDAEKGITMKLGAETIYPNPEKTSESGYFKTSYMWNEITPDKGRLEVAKTSPGVAWGGIYRQYFENLDAVKNVHSADVKLDKKIYLKIYENGTTKLQEISENHPVKVGDIVTVRIVATTNKAMQYIHLKDMRAAGMEPVDVLSGYHYQNGAGYYQNTRDTATNFFLDYLPAGTYVFEYELKANNAGNFTAGITTFQNMYGPAMSAHTAGSKVVVER